MEVYKISMKIRKSVVIVNKSIRHVSLYKILTHYTVCGKMQGQVSDNPPCVHCLRAVSLVQDGY